MLFFVLSDSCQPPLLIQVDNETSEEVMLVQKLIDSPSLSGVPHQALLNKIAELWRPFVRDLGRIHVNDVVQSLESIRNIHERRLSCCQFVREATKRPYINLF